MTNRPTFDELLQSSKTEIQTLDPRLVDFTPGAVLAGLAIVHGMAAEQSIAVSVNEFRQSFVATATGPTENDATDYLQRRITDFGGPVRPVATAATTDQVLARGSYVGAYTLTAGDEVRGVAADGSPVVFQVKATVTLGTGDGSVDFVSECTTTGRAGNVDAGTLTNCPALPAGLTVTQPARAAGGAPVLSDEDYRALYALQVEAQTPGTVAAIEYGAKLVNGVRFATVDESKIAPADGGFVSVYIGDPDAGSTSTMVDNVRAELLNWRAGGVEVRIFGAEREELDWTITVKVLASSLIDAERVENAWIEYLDAVKVARRVYLSDGEAYIHATLGADIRSCDIAADATPTVREIVPSQPYYAIRTAANGSGVTVNLTRVST
jgi:uncharacterized phage protein gp47/JayE